MPTRIFISYQRDTEREARELHDKLTAAGFDVWQDVHHIRHTARWSVEINQALHDCERIVLLLTPTSMASDEVFNEWFFFYNQRKPIHCLMVEQVTPFYQLVPFQYLVWTQPEKRDWARLAAELSAPFAWPSVALRERVINSPHAPARSDSEALQALLDAVRSEARSVALTDVQLDKIARHKPADLTEYRAGRIAEWSQPRYQLDNRFVQLTLLIDQGEDAQGARWAAPEERRFNDLRHVLAARPHDPALVLLGAPGSGKSTLLRRLQLDDAIACLRSGGDTLTLFAPLNAYKTSSGTPRAWLNSLWTRDYPALPALDDLLGSGRMLLLLDALNEMPHKTSSEYHERVGAWRDFIQEIVPRGNRAVFSCRSLDYSASLSAPELRVPQIVVQPMNDEQMQEFLAAYVPARAGEVWRELDATKQLDLFRTPYFLKLLCELVEAQGGVPQGRAGLFTGFVREALAREKNRPLFLPNGLLDERDHQKLSLRKWRDPYELPERGILIPSLARLAYAMQIKGLESEGAQLRIDYQEACARLAHDRDSDILKAGVALNVLDEDITEGQILFFHQLLQEFFAARRLAAEAQPQLVRVEWQTGKATPPLAETLARLADSDPLPPLAQTGWEETTALAAVMSADPDAFVRGLLDANLPLAGRIAAAPDTRLNPALKADIQQALIARTQDYTADVRARIAAGLALGTLGDPRFERRTGPYGDYLLPPLLTIAAGEYPIGDDASNYDFEKPAHKVKLDAFQIGKFPVTNAEYALFIAAGGYDDERWWDTDAAQAWRRGEGTAEGPKQSWRDNHKMFQSWTDGFIRQLVEQNRITSKQADDWETIRGWTEEELEAWLDETFPGGRHTQPDYWDDSTYNHPAQPVVGICWYEARAYCAWLTAQVGGDEALILNPSPEGRRTLNSEDWERVGESEALNSTRGIRASAVDNAKSDLHPFSLREKGQGDEGFIFRLPTEAEFEAAARGKNGRQFPYDGAFDAARCNTFESHIRRTTPIGVFDNATPEGAYDLSGNAYTWTSSIYDQDTLSYSHFPANDPRREDPNRTYVRRVLRGGSWYYDLGLARALSRNLNLPAFRNYGFGFRVVAVFVPS
jgi:formylglycine-generating enzyme required for sulfatase activity